MDITMIGLQNAGKTSLLRVLAGGEFTIDSIPTVGFNMKRVQKGHVTLKCWDLGGQPRFRSMWERYCRGVNAIVYIVDAADKEALPIAAEELHALLEKPVLDGIPLLVLGNKSDLPEKLSVDQLIEALNLKAVSHREVSCYGISAKEETNLDAVLQWLIARTSNCITARRRRRAGFRPYPLTGWAAGRTPPGHAPAQYTGGPAHPYNNNPGTDYSHQNPPIYSAPPNPPPNQNIYGNGNQGYFGGQQSGVELQQPNNAYQPPRGDESVYGAPPGPPPGKKESDGFIR
ncbi:MAG: hypothetical protein Q9187_003096 [Circinaria calcarea]